MLEGCHKQINDWETDCGRRNPSGKQKVENNAALAATVEGVAFKAS